MKKPNKAMVLEVARLEKIQHVTRAAAIEAAKSKSSPLHRWFTWNVKQAAYRCWLDEAGELLRLAGKLMVKYESRAIMVPCRVSNGEQARATAAYIPVKTLTVRTAPDMMRNELNALLCDMERVIGLAVIQKHNLPGGLAGKIDKAKSIVSSALASL